MHQNRRDRWAKIKARLRREIARRARRIDQLLPWHDAHPTAARMAAHPLAYADGLAGAIGNVRETNPAIAMKNAGKRLLLITEGAQATSIATHSRPGNHHRGIGSTGGIAGIGNVNSHLMKNC